MGTKRLTEEERLRRRRARSKAWKDANQERVKKDRRLRYQTDRTAALERAKKWYRANKAYVLATSSERQLARFGLSLDDYLSLLERQGGKCGICGHCPGEGDRRLSIDHDHVTLTIRGLLCIRCNVGLGQFLEKPELLTEAARYLREQTTRFKLPRPLNQNPRRTKRMK